MNEDDGLYQLQNSIAEALARITLTAYESRACWAIFRKTFLWRKTEDRISISQFVDMTGLSRRNISRTLKLLSARRVCIPRDTPKGTTYRFNKKVSEWIHGIRRDDILSSEGIQSVIRRDDHKETNKETIQSKPASSSYKKEALRESFIERLVEYRIKEKSRKVKNLEAYKKALLKDPQLEDEWNEIVRLLSLEEEAKQKNRSDNPRNWNGGARSLASISRKLGGYEQYKVEMIRDVLSF